MGSFEQPELVDFFTQHRTTTDDLYPSERRFLPDLARSADSVLDVGCATGGFADVWHSFNDGIRYTGVDVSAEMIAAARSLHPRDTFLVGDAAATLPLPERSADVVAALGWLHWEPRYETALAELWRLTGRSLFFDIRLHTGTEDIVGVQDLPGGGTTPYVCAPWTRLRRLLLSLEAKTIRGYGYDGPPAATVRGMPEQLCLAAFVVERGAPPAGLELELPFDTGSEPA